MDATPCRVVVALVALLVAATTATAEGPAPVVVTDAAGQTVRLERLPQRIVILGDASYVIAHLLYMFPEGRQRLVGMERKGGSASDFLPLLDPTFSSRAFLSHGAGPEQIAGLHPDLALVRSSTLDRRAATLAKVGIPLVHLGLESPERYPEDLRLLGLLLGNPARAEEVADYYRGRLAAVSAPLAGAPEAEQPRVLLAMAMPRGGSVAVQVPARPWMQSQLVSLAGGRPVWLDEASPTSGWTVVNLEQIAAWDPDRDPGGVLALARPPPRARRSSAPTRTGPPCGRCRPDGSTPSPPTCTAGTRPTRAGSSACCGPRSGSTPPASPVSTSTPRSTVSTTCSTAWTRPRSSTAVRPSIRVDLK